MLRMARERNKRLSCSSVPTDVNSFVSQDTEIQPKSGGLVPMGVKIKVPNTHFINVRGTMFRTLGGVGDSDYRGPMYFIVYNNTCEPMIFKQGDQAGHFVIVKIRTPPLELLN